MSHSEIPRTGWRRLLAWPTRRTRQVVTDVDDEVAFHLAMRAAEYERGGVVTAHARQKAEQRFGDVARTRRELIEADRATQRRWNVARWLTDARYDLVAALRRLSQSPGFTAITIATLSLGVGSAAVIEGALQRMVLSPFPFRGADRLVFLGLKTADGSIRVSVNDDVIAAWGRGVPGLERVEVVATRRMKAIRSDRPTMMSVGLVTPGLLSFLGVRPALGRVFAPSDTAKTASPVAMLSFQMWMRDYGADPDAVGKSITLGRTTYAIVGVTPRLFDPSVFAHGPRSDVWIPYQPDPSHNSYTMGIGVLRVGAAFGTLDKDLGARLTQLPQGQFVRTLLPDTHPLLGTAGAAVKRVLYLMTAAVGLLLVIGCFNVANLLLARGAARSREMAIRNSLGAGRGRLVRQLLAESLLLGALGSLGGVVLSHVLLRAARAARPEALAALDDLAIDARTFTFALVAALVTSLLFGLAPAILASQPGSGFQGGLRTVGLGTAGRRVRRLLVFAEIASSVALVIGATLLVRSALAVDALRLGYDVDPLVTIRLGRVGDSTQHVRIDEILRPVVERLRAYPGVRAAAAGSQQPGEIGGCICSLSRADAPKIDERLNTFTAMLNVDSAFLATTGTRMLAGRTPSSDTTRREAAITQAAANRLWPNDVAIGKQFRFGDGLMTVVGIVEPQRTLEGWLPADSILVLAGSSIDSHGPVLAVRVDNATEAVARELAALVAATSPQLEVQEARAFKNVVHEARAPQRFTRLLLIAFAALALLLSALGLYGVMAFSVTQRTREIGVRMALGAKRADIGRLIAWEGLLLVIAGIGAGVLGAILLTKLLDDSLIGVSRRDSVSYLLAIATIVLSACAALLLPVLRSTRVSPTAAVSAE